MGVKNHMGALYAVEAEPEVRAWLELLPGKHFRKVEGVIGRSAARANDTSTPSLPSLATASTSNRH